MTEKVVCFIAALSTGCLDTEHGEMSQGELVELVCVRFAECAGQPMQLDGGAGEVLDIRDAVACSRSARSGWAWLDEDGGERILGEAPRDGFGSPRCLSAVDALPCPIAGDIDAIELVLDACSGG